MPSQISRKLHALFSKPVRDEFKTTKETETIGTGGSYKLKVHRDQQDGTLHLDIPKTEAVPAALHHSSEWTETPTRSFRKNNDEQRDLILGSAARAADRETRLGARFSPAHLAMLEPMTDMYFDMLTPAFAHVDGSLSADALRCAFLMGPMMLEDVGLLPVGQVEASILPRSNVRTMSTVVSCLLGAAMGNYYKNKEIEKKFFDGSFGSKCFFGAI